MPHKQMKAARNTSLPLFHTPLFTSQGVFIVTVRLCRDAFAAAELKKGVIINITLYGGLLMASLCERGCLGLH